MNIDDLLYGFNDVHILCETKKTKDPNSYYLQLDSKKYFKLFTYNDSFIVNDVYAL